MGEASADRAGRAVSVSGNGRVVAIGAPVGRGTVRTFEYVEGVEDGTGDWTQVG